MFQYDVNVIHRNTVNVLSDSVIAPVSPCPSSSSDNFISQCYIDSLIKHPKQMNVKIVSFCQYSNNVNNNHFRSREKDNRLLKGFNNHHIKNTCFVSAIFWELLLHLIFVNNNLFSDSDLAYGSNCTYNFLNSTLLLHRSPEVIACYNRTNFLTGVFSGIYFRQIHIVYQFYKIISNVNIYFYLFYYPVWHNLCWYFELFMADLHFSELWEIHRSVTSRIYILHQMNAREFAKLKSIVKNISYLFIQVVLYPFSYPFIPCLFTVYISVTSTLSL